jgi:hypothetical protein
MRITIEPTSALIQIKVNGVYVPARVWEGQSEQGVKVVALITRITPLDGDSTEFERDLQETKPPSPEARQAFPMRLIL